MDVIWFLLSLMAVGTVLYFLAIGAVIAGVIVWAFWPTILGLVAGIWVWVSGHDNVGAMIILTGIAVQIFIHMRSPSGSFSSNTPPGMSEKTKIYDKQGNVKGYADKQ